MQTEVIVVGGGPAGLMAAISAAQHGANVTLLDKGKKLGRKLAISGGGRCNVTNRMALDELIKHIPGNGKFMHSPFSIFNNEDIISFFEDMGIPLKEEDMGRMFPVNDKAVTVVRTLLDKLEELGVTMLTKTEVHDLLMDEDRIKGVQLADGTQREADAVILATGGKSVPHTGSTGDGYPWAVKAGHTITDLYPTEVPITSPDDFIQSKELQGLSLQDVALSVTNHKGKTVITHRGDMIFTHFGISGPIVLRCSQYVVKERKKKPDNLVTLLLSLYPEAKEESLFQQLVTLKKDQGQKSIKNVLKAWAPERLLLLLLKKSSIPSDTRTEQVANESLRQLAHFFTRFPIAADGTLSIEEAFVTGGGVSIKEVHPKTLGSKKKDGLYFCGELLDIHAYTGGYNITCAFSTGYASGKAAAETLQPFIQ
ncbi:NAD(P)/FAD-dependent oxidoreductase [Salsuginibacillus kocurii]|uniref:NAD(P)/FAD-dependent oxidoreductase n=1 Tax=Salsuginibacillus kocurii TaxID=427078 RepID=UPI00036BDD19|nr:NAD(P)/FAD-dependent oxidoreductase [Salsuginibacillus kocurii]